MLCWTPDYTSDSITDCPHYWLFIFAYYFSLIVYSLIHMLTHIICTCTIPLLFYKLIGSLHDDPGFAHTDWMFDFIDQVLMSSYALRGPEVSFCSILIFLLLFYSCYFLIFFISHPVAISYL